MKTGKAGSGSTVKPRAVMLSKRANVFYLEHVRVMQKDERLVYLTDSGDEVERYFNIPERNTAFLLLGKGTSITDAAARRLADANVLIGFCGSGGSPLYSMAEISFLAPQSEYRPTEYMQSWVKMWFDEPQRLTLGQSLLRERVDRVSRAWADNPVLLKKQVQVDSGLSTSFLREIGQGQHQQDLLLAEARWAKCLYARLAEAFRIDDFAREEGKGSRESRADVVNGFLDHGNYIAYGYAAVALNGLGISFSLPLLHGKTRRGALVFDIADLIKDALVMPLAFEMGAAGAKQQDFRLQLIETCQKEEVLDYLFTFVETLCKNIV